MLGHIIIIGGLLEWCEKDPFSSSVSLSIITHPRILVHGPSRPMGSRLYTLLRALCRFRFIIFIPSCTLNVCKSSIGVFIGMMWDQQVYIGTTVLHTTGWHRVNKLRASEATKQVLEYLGTLVQLYLTTCYSHINSKNCPFNGCVPRINTLKVR